MEARSIRSAALIALRDPREVAHSLARRNRMAPDVAMLSWVAHTLGAIDSSCGMPRAIVVFPDWVRNPGATLRRIAALDSRAVPENVQNKIAEIFVGDAMHGRADTTAFSTPIEDLALDLFMLLRNTARSDEVPDGALLDPFRQRFAVLSAAARGVEESHADRHLTTRAKIAELNKRYDEIAADAARRIAATEAQRDEMAAAAARRISATEAQRDEISAAAARRILATEMQRDEIAADAARRISAAEAQRDEMVADAARQTSAAEAQRDEMAADAARQISAAEAQRDEMAADAARRISIAKARRDEIGRQAAVQQEEFAEVSHIANERLEEIGALQNELELTKRTHSESLTRLERERMTLLKPIYWRLYRRGGRILRAILPAPMLEHIKRRLPVPGGIPRSLAFTPLPSAPLAANDFSTVPARRSNKPDIFVLSIISWDFRVQRPQHLATQMAAEGHRVFYVDMERDMGGGTAREVAANLYVVRLPTKGMRSLPAYTGVPTTAQANAWVGHFHTLADAVNASPVAHVVVEHPYWWHLARHLSPEYQITFDCMDDIGGFSNTESHILETEMDMVARADKMVVSSQYLYDKFGTIRDVVMVRNGTDVSHFADVPENITAPAWLGSRRSETAIRVGYVGAIAEWFDTDLIEKVARENPDFEIHLCGAVTAQQPMRLASLGNVTMHGEISYKDVPAFHKQMDVLIIPFQLLPIIKACDPVKFYEYSAAMRPTVSTPLPELERAGELVFRADDPAAFAAQIRYAAPLAQDAEFGHRLRQYALDNAWSFRASEMLREMQREPKLSVVVLHYGEDIDMTLAALHALVGRGQVYPNIEVVLVDNGSSAEVLEVLRKHVAADSRVVMVENSENLGFAKGNNRGIEVATGEFILLLNNDTFIAPGAMLAMIRHLQRNPEIGIVGPITNNIGNEARIEIAYTDMEAMVRAARDIATGHRGQWTSIAVCAYFCAMFRRADLDRLGLLPEIYGRGMFEDDDHCATFRATGLQMALAEDAFCHHHLSATFDKLPSTEKQMLFERNKSIFEERWGRWVPHVYRDTRPPATLPKT